LSKDRPSAVQVARCRLPASSSRKRRTPSVRSLQGSEHVPSMPFLTTSTVCSTRPPAGLLHPAAGHGVRRVSSSEARRVSSSSSAPFSRRHHPSKLFPRQQPCRVTAERCFCSGDVAAASASASLCFHRGLCLLAVRIVFRCSVRRYCYPFTARLRRTADLKALLHCRVRCCPPPLPAADRPMLPWALDLHHEAGARRSVRARQDPILHPSASEEVKGHGFDVAPSRRRKLRIHRSQPDHRGRAHLRRGLHGPPPPRRRHPNRALASERTAVGTRRCRQGLGKRTFLTPAEPRSFPSSVGHERN
jgi:hypothetical protein